MAKYPKVQPISLPVQCTNLISTYKNLVDECCVKNGVLVCIMRITPSPNSETYRVKIVYKLSLRNGEFSPRVWLISPQMQKREGKYPKHIYATRADANGNQCLCLYYPGYNEWNRNMLISNTIVPWIAAWLNTYEYWLITGEWHYDESPHGGHK